MQQCNSRGSLRTVTGDLRRFRATNRTILLPLQTVDEPGEKVAIGGRIGYLPTLRDVGLRRCRGRSDRKHVRPFRCRVFRLPALGVAAYRQHKRGSGGHRVRMRTFRHVAHVYFY